GEFHSFVFEAPVFRNPISCTKGEIVYKKYKAPNTNDNNSHSNASEYGFYFCDLLHPSDGF
ncbi:MAG: ATP-binding protein, partial [Bacteroidota bacterium]